MAAELKARKDMDKRYMWDLTQIYKTNEDWEKAFVELQARIPEVGRYSGTMGTPAGAKAALDGFIRKLPKGYDTPVGELGGALSGGERQRIGVARAFLHDASFLLLDEPTSNLDSLNEGVILKAVRAECKDKTVLLVSHRKSTMAAADISFSVESGRLS